MKKIKLLSLELLICILVLTFLLSSCGAKNKSNVSGDNKVAKYDTVIDGRNTSFYSVYSSYYFISGMKYKVFNSYQGGMFVVNVTKDSLECLIDSMIIAEKHFKLK